MTPVPTSNGLTVDLPGKISHLNRALVSAPRHPIIARYGVIAGMAIAPQLKADAEPFGPIHVMEQHVDEYYFTKSGKPVSAWLGTKRKDLIFDASCSCGYYFVSYAATVCLAVGSQSFKSIGIWDHREHIACVGYSTLY
jgi:hypothetical protein